MYPIKKLQDCATIIAGQSPESKYYNSTGEGIPFFQGKADFGELYPKVRVYCSSPTKIAQYNDILLSVRAPVGPTNLSPGTVCIGRGLAAIRPDDSLDLKYLLYYFRYFETQLSAKGTGTTFKAINQKLIKNLEIPIPPLNEQFLIVAHIEELFSELDKAVGTLKTIKEQLEVYRQAVLKDAFSDFEKKDSIRNLTMVVTSGSRGWAKYYSNSGALFVRIGNLTHSGIDIDFRDIQHITPPDNAEGVRTRLQPNDVLVSITADLGSIGFVSEKVEEAYINQHIALVRFQNPVQGRFMAWYLRSEYGQKDLLKNKRGGGKLGLGLDDIRDTPVPIVDDVTAKETVDKIEEQLSVCNSIEKTVDTALVQTDAMRQSILKQAFKEGSI